MSDVVTINRSKLYDLHNLLISVFSSDNPGYKRDTPTPVDTTQPALTESIRLVWGWAETDDCPDHAAEVERLTGERDALACQVAALKEIQEDGRKRDERTMERVERLQTHFKDTIRQILFLDDKDAIGVLESERDAAVRERDAAVEALRFYADRKSYDGHYMMSPHVTEDQGKHARAALAKIEGGQHA